MNEKIKQDDSLSKSKEITTIAMGVATLIGGGMGIYFISAFFAVPGSKYLLMAPYLSTIFYVMQFKLKSKYTLLKIGTVFALIMTVINIFMGMAILLTTLLTYLTVLPINHIESRAFWGSVLFSGYAGGCALLITKYFIGGLDAVSNVWILVVAVICAGFGVLGTGVAKRVLNNMGIRKLHDHQNE